MIQAINTLYQSGKKILSLLALILMISSTLLGQGVPQAFNYQAVVRDANGEVIANTPVQVRMTIKSDITTAPLYVELHSTTTNAFGLVSLQLGWGQVISGDFPSIEWEAGDYGLSTDVSIDGDPFIEMGSSQLLSIPYAIVAQRTVEGDADADPTNELNTAAELNGTNLNITDAGGTLPVDLSILDQSAEVAFAQATADQAITDAAAAQTSADAAQNTADQASTDAAAAQTSANAAQGTADQANVAATAAQSAIDAHISADEDTDATNEIELPTGGNNDQILSTDGNGNYNWTDVGGGSSLAIGDFYGGGVIFWLDASGNHGLIAAKSDFSQKEWGQYSITGATVNAKYGGERNTDLIVDDQGAGNYAAKVCKDYSVIENDNEYYDDWYLPSKHELFYLYVNRAVINATATANGGSNFDNYIFYSSTEVNNSKAWGHNFVTGNQIHVVKNGFGGYNVRAIRAF